jgi:hypothetical protein
MTILLEPAAIAYETDSLSIVTHRAADCANRGRACRRVELQLSDEMYMQPA